MIHLKPLTKHIALHLRNTMASLEELNHYSRRNFNARHGSDEELLARVEAMLRD